MADLDIGQSVFVHPNYSQPYRIIDQTPSAVFSWIQAWNGEIHFVKTQHLQPFKLDQEERKRCLRLISFNPCITPAKNRTAA